MAVFFVPSRRSYFDQPIGCTVLLWLKEQDILSIEGRTGASGAYNALSIDTVNRI